jgi:hypothetical protein
MAERDFSNPLVQTTDDDFDLQSKQALTNGPYRPKVLASGTNYTGVNLMCLQFSAEATINSATVTDAEGDVAGTYPAGTLLPFHFTQVQVTSTGPILGYKAGDSA